MEIDRHEDYIAVCLEKNCIIIFKLVKTAVTSELAPTAKTTVYECQPCKLFGPFGSGQRMRVDDYCTYMAVLGENERCINYFIFDWEYKCKVVQRRRRGLYEDQEKKMKNTFLQKLNQSRIKVAEA